MTPSPTSAICSWSWQQQSLPWWWWSRTHTNVILWMNQIASPAQPCLLSHQGKLFRATSWGNSPKYTVNPRAVTPIHRLTLAMSYTKRMGWGACPLFGHTLPPTHSQSLYAHPSHSVPICKPTQETSCHIPLVEVHCIQKQSFNYHRTMTPPSVNN